MEVITVTCAVILGVFIIKHKPDLALPVTCGYLLALIYVTFLMRLSMTLEKNVFEPFLTGIKLVRSMNNLIEHITSGERFTGEILDVGKGIVLNVLIFIPFGYLLPTVFPSASPLFKTLLLGFVVSLFIEVVQQLSHLGMFDTFDLANNTLGTLIGCALYKKLLYKETTSGEEE